MYDTYFWKTFWFIFCQAIVFDLYIFEIVDDIPAGPTYDFATKRYGKFYRIIGGFVVINPYMTGWQIPAIMRYSRRALSL